MCRVKNCFHIARLRKCKIEQGAGAGQLVVL